MKAGEFCNREVVVIVRDASVTEAAKLMRTHHVGSLVVVDAEAGNPRPVGMLTDRDIVIELVADEASPSAVTVGELMSEVLVTVDEDTALFETIELMRQHDVRRVPVVDSNGRLVGLMASDDALDLLTEQLSDLVAIATRQQAREGERRR